MSCDVVELELYLFKSLQSWNGIYDRFMRAYASSRVKKKELLYRKTELQNGTPIWRLHAMLYKGAWNISANNSETVGHKDLGLGQLKVSSCQILPHCYGPLRAVNGPCVLHKASLLLTVRMLSIYGACISLLHKGTMRYGSFDPYGPKTYGACISLLHQGTMRYGSFNPYDPHGKRGVLQL